MVSLDIYISSSDIQSLPDIDIPLFAHLFVPFLNVSFFREISPQKIYYDQERSRASPVGILVSIAISTSQGIDFTMSGVFENTDMLTMNSPFHRLNGV